jgi:hypothetical protein
VGLHLALCTKLRLNHSISCLRERLFKVWISSPASTVSSCMCYSHRAVGAGAGGGAWSPQISYTYLTHRINSCPRIFRPSYGPVVSSAEQRKRNLPTFSTKMRYTKGPQIKQANRPTGSVRRPRWRGRRRRRWTREGSSYVFLLRGVNRCSIESGIVILLLYDTLFLSSSWLFMTVTKFSLPIRLYCIGV